MSKASDRFQNPLIALDIGNVSMKLSFDEMYGYLGVDPKDIAGAVSRLWVHGNALETGRCTVPEFLDRLDEFTGHKHTHRELLDFWRSGVRETMPGMAKAIEKLASRGIRFSFFSDISPIHLEQVFKYCEFRHLITGGVYSFEVGALKMDDCVMLDAFEARYGRPAVFFDDREQIIQRATSYGWNAIQFTSADQFLCEVSVMF
jgi:hypothetical protein